MGEFFESYLLQICEKIKEFDGPALQECSSLVADCSNNGGQVLIFGNGGSAAMASHVSVDLVKAARIRASNFNEADLLTCFANDFGYEWWVQKCIEFYSRPKDLVILISSSGQSQNMLNGAKYARRIGLPIVTLSGFSADNPLRKLGDVNLYVASDAYNYVEMTHHTWLLAIVDHLIAAETQA